MEDKEHPLLTVAGFKNLYGEYLSQTTSCRAAYECAEVDFIQQYNHRRYKNYDSFKKALSQWHKVNRDRKNRQAGRQAA